MQKRGLITEEVAEAFYVSPKSVSRRYHLTGSYYGVKPMKLPTGRLLWPLDIWEQLMGSEEFMKANKDAA